MVLNITPLKKFHPWGDSTVLIVIREKEHKSRLPFEEIPKYITIEEYCSIFPEAVPLSGRKFDERASELKKEVEERLKVENITK